VFANAWNLNGMRRRERAGQGRSARRLRVPLTLEALEDRFLLSVYAVINTNDNGQGSLRQAILDANANTTQANTIIFDIQGQGPHTIRPLSPLPTITNPVTIDATSQPGYAGTPLIELDGSMVPFANGFTIAADNSVVRGLDIIRFNTGVSLQGDGDRIEGSYLGTDPTGTQALGNFTGILISGSDDLVGGTAAGAGNLISGNQQYGVWINGGSNVVQGNTIGTDVTGTQPLSNDTGVAIIGSDNLVGGTDAGAGNLISGNRSGGVGINGNNNVVQGNLIGTDITGTQSLGNILGVFITGSGNLVGGTDARASNLISGNNLAAGVTIEGSNNVVQGNQIGTDITGTQPLGNGSGVVILLGSDNLIGGTDAGAGNLISGNTNAGIAIVYSSNNVVQGNLIGTDVTGTRALGNHDGVLIEGGPDNNTADNNLIGGTTAAAANVISGNGGSGVLLSGVNVQSNLIEGNFIGTDVSATLNLGNAADGVTIQNAAAVGGVLDNTIGGTAAGAGNIIAFNGHDGVLVDASSGNAILSDLIFANGNLGIELLHNGNHNQAAPLLTGAFVDGPNTVIQGVLQSTPNTTFTVQLFADAGIDPSGLAEGQQLLGTVTVTTDAFGFAAFTATIPEMVPAGQVVTATATDADNDTSEFSTPVTVTAA
jgi:hypothetical protein